MFLMVRSGKEVMRDAVLSKGVVHPKGAGKVREAGPQMSVGGGGSSSLSSFSSSRADLVLVHVMATQLQRLVVPHTPHTQAQLKDAILLSVTQDDQ